MADTVVGTFSIFSERGENMIQFLLAFGLTIIFLVMFDLIIGILLETEELQRLWERREKSERKS